MKVCWNITGKCNKNCRFCYRDNVTEELSLEQNLNILDNLLKLDVTKITFSGGEPLLYDGIKDIFKESKKKGIYNKLNTNGSLLTEDTIKDLLKYVDRVAFSVDSASDEENYFLGKGTSHYKHIKEIIPIILKKYPHIKFDINTVVTSQTIHGLDDLFKSLVNDYQDKQIDRWKIIRFCPAKGMDETTINRFSVTDSEFDSVVNKYKNEKKLFSIMFVDNEESNNKNVVNPLGILELVKKNKRTYKDLKNENIVNKNKYTQTQSDDNYFLNTNLNLYKIFFQVAQYGSLSLASKKMLISQPAISRAVKKLEEELDVTLFYRTINGMNLTEKGKELFTYVEEAYNSIRIGERSMMESSNLYRGKLIVGAPSHIASFYLFDKIKKFHRDYPQIEVSIISRSTADLIKLLENHKLDFILDTAPITGNEKVLNIEELAEFEHCFVARCEHNYNDEINRLKDLEEYQLILPVAHSYHRKKLNDIALNNDTTFKNVISIETSEMIKESIIQDLGIGYIIKEVVKREIENGILEEIKIEEKLNPITIDLVYIDKYLSNIPKKFIENYLR